LNDTFVANLHGRRDPSPSGGSRENHGMSTDKEKTPAQGRGFQVY
jgi:hypothetical protein